MRAPVAKLGSAGGWVGAAVADPLGHALGGAGAATVFLAVLVVALVVFTGVTVRTAAVGVGRAARWALATGPGGRAPAATPPEDSDEDEPTDPFGRAVAETEPEGPVVAEAVPV